MRFSNVVLTAIAAAGVQADEALYTVFYNDVTENAQEYLSYIQANTAAGFTDLLSLYTELATYTDDSYTSIFTEEDFPASELSSFVVNLPWYSSRIEPQVAAAETGESEEESETGESEEESETGEETETETGSESESESESETSATGTGTGTSASESAETETSTDAAVSIDHPKSTLLMGLTAAVVSITFGVFAL
ncbi:Cell wall mannoprotein with putative lipase activity [Komagataella phaffii CBS 7435]|uniref:Uncharacterized protein n=2 Tax=Komagataella phaffii TaxID=460519 RepID=C4R859_KOMPG|nr:uncharacterized protein PAS_chr4_0972 [Komagataella phaffii GS115]AOA64976.1 GQ67_04895T0 [Komagataella phaffii]CAH2450822.1 Cell wall mannoprotein with putative lipase activity [Komagataella phaffii CBS 7435]AOA69993.1 GQ68_04867T0 [Komagataella phaffii GS115]CAY71784.1 hypothetical protein PAS_chr4_0972 [Komagataella phaffii GS115]CCA40615.1 Cell wall mannoprotein with putative lipase activity [Komagataella phaffii CBS 7435]